jgi:hypothetical protein
MCDQLKITPPREKDEQSRSENCKADKKKPDVPNACLGVPPHTPPTPTCAYQADKENGGFLKIIKEWLEPFAILAGVVLVGVNIIMWRDARKVFKTDERAWVFTTGNVAVIFSQDNSSAVFDVPYKNTGKTPALNVRAINVWTTNFNIISPIKVIPNDAINTGFCAPDDSGQIPTKPIPAQYMAGIRDGIPIYIFGAIWYDDIFGGHHLSQFCYEANRSPMNTNIIQFNYPKISSSCDDDEANKATK